ncbi:hypothetical protein GF354_03375 [Candidatus Peregrinibacteria bacterium]|nr:hypothetical protein [Candidatus Peregrinibacteria bacterium]
MFEHTPSSNAFVETANREERGEESQEVSDLAVETMAAMLKARQWMDELDRGLFAGTSNEVVNQATEASDETPETLGNYFETRFDELNF